jgi:hypothetical protein
VEGGSGVKYFIFALTTRYCGPAITAHGSLDLKQEIQIQIQKRDTDRGAKSFSLVQ